MWDGGGWVLIGQLSVCMDLCIIPNILYNIIDVVICIDERKRVFEVRYKRVAKLNKKF